MPHHPHEDPYTGQYEGRYEGRYEGQYEDGNALAGPLSEILAVDPTTAVGRCAGCGSHWPLARLHVYAHAPGYVGRCPDCDHVILRLVRSPDKAWLDLRGTVALTFSLDT